jgi:hypothetical protein
MSGIRNSLAQGLDFRISGDGLGHVNMRCVVDDSAGMGNTLAFDIDFDQAEIPEILASSMRSHRTFQFVTSVTCVRSRVR